MSSPREILSKLERAYALALGEYQTAEIATETIVGIAALEAADRRIQARRAVLQEKMDRIDYLIRLQVDPEWDRSSVRPLIPRSNRGKGAVSKLAYGILKKADDPMTAREIARGVARELGLGNPDDREINRLEGSIRGALERRRKDGMVERHEGKPTRWSLKAGRWSPAVRPASSVRRS